MSLPFFSGVFRGTEFLMPPILMPKMASNWMTAMPSSHQQFDRCIVPALHLRPIPCNVRGMYRAPALTDTSSSGGKPYEKSSSLRIRQQGFCADV
jgi:hypothetical protein